jgi:hypothetical protein
LEIGDTNNGGTMKEVMVDGVKYVEESEVKQAENFNLVRSHGAGVFAGEIVRRDGKEVEMKNAIRIWYWDGAASLSQLAKEGTTAPQNCKFCVPVSVTLLDVIEILKCTDKARESIQAVKSWKR